MKLSRLNRNRRGTVAAFFALLLIPMLALVALCVDYGYLLVVKTDLQRAADATALAAVRDLIPAPDGSQDLSTVHATVRQYAALNAGNDNFQVRDEDIVIGRFDPATVYGDMIILNDGILDTVKVTLRRDSLANNPVSLFFARIIGFTDSTVSVSATAVLQKAQGLPPGTDMLPIAIPESSWHNQTIGENWSIYGDGQIVDNEGNTIPGNYGTLDIGDSDNSTRDLVRQIREGLAESDLSELNSEGRTGQSGYIGGTEQFWVQADTGLSVGMKSAVIDNHGATKLVPIIDTVNAGTGNTAEYLVVGWGVVQIVDSHWEGSFSSRQITVKKAYMYDEDLRANPDLSDVVDIVEAAYTSPALVFGGTLEDSEDD
jgi:Flp pilus assembly protein TadG